MEFYPLSFARYRRSVFAASATSKTFLHGRFYARMGIELISKKYHQVWKVAYSSLGRQDRFQWKKLLEYASKHFNRIKSDFDPRNGNQGGRDSAGTIKHCGEAFKTILVNSLTSTPKSADRQNANFNPTVAIYFSTASKSGAKTIIRFYELYYFFWVYTAYLVVKINRKSFLKPPKNHYL